MSTTATDYQVVQATKQEIADLKKSRGHAPIVDRVSCKRCGRRIWLSGAGERAHERWHARGGENQPKKTRPKTTTVKAAADKPNDQTKPKIAETKAAAAVKANAKKAPAPKFGKGDRVEVREEGIKPWQATVTTVKYSKVSGWRLDVVRDDDPKATWNLPETIAFKIKG